MPLLRQLTLRARFQLAIVIVTLSLVALGAWGVLANQKSIQQVSALFDQASAGAGRVARLRESLGEVRRLEASLIAVGASNAIELERLAGLWRAEIDAAKTAADALTQAHPGDAAMARLVATQHQLLADYAAAIGPIADQLQAAKIDGPVALAYAGQAEDKAKALQTHSDAILNAQQLAHSSYRDQMAAASNLVSLLQLALVAATLAVVLPLLWLTLRPVCGPVDQALAVASRNARGDLGETLHVDGDDEMARLLRALQAMQESLRRLVGQVRESAQSIARASAEVASGNQDLNERTEQASSNLRQTAGSIGQLTGTVTHSADSARLANTLAASAAAVAQRGGTAVSQVVATMSDINSSSRRIADIVGTIDGIAFQSNFLALNAAVEAARAGEQGRGFAVVASEVRNLAQRSATAAREIKGLIGASVDKVETGAHQVADAGSTMQEIVASVQRVTDIIGQISAAAGEQSGGIGEVNQAISLLDRMTQQNAALVEQSAAAAESLKQQAQTLEGLVATFRLGHEAGVPSGG